MTKENAKDFLPLVTALAEGKTIQSQNLGGWEDYHPTTDFYFDLQPHQYRIKPTPKLRPWRPEEVPVGALYRATGQTKYKQMILGVSPHGIKTSTTIETDTEYRFDEMLCDFEHSLDRGKTWLPCGVEEDAA